jgi:molybdopterin synthase sulfur carrier subunit
LNAGHIGSHRRSRLSGTPARSVRPLGEAFALGNGEATVGALLAALRARGGVFAQELAPGRAIRVAVNHTMAGDDTAIVSGDEVAVFPPVTGG